MPELAPPRRGVAVVLLAAQCFLRFFVSGLWEETSDVWETLRRRNLIDAQASSDTTEEYPTLYNPSSACERSLGGTNVTVIMVADPGTFSGFPERMHYVDNLIGANELSSNSTVCFSKVKGLLLGQPVVVVTTGIGPVAAALCTLELLACAKGIKEVFFVGTSGWSPQPGGVLSVVPYHKSGSETEAAAPGCKAANPSPRINRLGDVCISTFYVNAMCTQADYDQVCGGYGNLCNLPNELAGPNATFLFGQCEFTASSPGMLHLAQELLQVAGDANATKSMPIRGSAVKDLEETYWEDMQTGTGVAYVYDAEAPPAVLDYTQCVEVDGQFFWSGPPYEMQARQFAAQALAEGLGMEVDMTQVTVASAMEGVGLAEAISKYNSLPGVRPLPYVSIRGMSDFVHMPVGQDTLQRWRYNSQVADDYVHGYQYAIATSSTLLLNLLKLRCEALSTNVLPGACDFRVQYT